MNHVETEKNLRVLYGCYIPKIDLSKTEVYHKELIVFAVQDEEIIGAETFDFKGNSRPIDTLNSFIVNTLSINILIL